MKKGYQENRLKEDFSLTMSSPEFFFFPSAVIWRNFWLFVNVKTVSDLYNQGIVYYT